MLAALLERPGVLVTRLELRQKLWPDGEFVDFDHSINQAACQIRTALRDDPRTPKFLETVPKRGYRFLQPVEALGAEAPAALPPAPTTSPGPVPVPEDLVPPSQAGVASEGKAPSLPQALRGRPAFWLWAGASLVAGLGLVALLLGHAFTRATPNFIYMGIIPFETSGPEAETLAESFRMDLTDSLSQLPALQIHAAHSLKGGAYGDDGMRTLIQSFHLDALLLGKLTARDGLFDLDCELVRGKQATHIATFHYHGTKDQLHAIRDQIQRDLLANLDVLKDQAKPVHGNTVVPAAYESYLQARSHFSQRTEASLQRAQAAYQTAIALDPTFANAFAGLASAQLASSNDSDEPRAAHVTQARNAATKAVQLDPAQAEAHAVLGYLAYNQDWDFSTAEREFRLAIQLKPNEAINRVLLSGMLCSQGRFQEAEQQVDYARVVEPLWPSVFIAAIHVAVCSKQIAKAVSLADDFVAFMPALPHAHDSRAWCLWYAGRFREAIQEWRTMAVLEKDEPLVAMEDRGLAAFRRGGAPAYARIRLDAIREGKIGRWHPYNFIEAEWRIYAEDLEGTFKALEAMVAARKPGVVDIATNPAFLGLHKDPRFQALVARVGLTP